jgi:hypothetical protein
LSSGGVKSTEFSLLLMGRLVMMGAGVVDVVVVVEYLL